MCGIFGVINTKDKIDEGRVLAARDILAHRGPDDAGVYFSPGYKNYDSPNPSSLDSARDDTELRVKSGQAARDDGEAPPFVALAHRRLSIIDLSPAGHQPMSTPDGRYTIVFNGEIYNFVEIRNEKLKIKNFKTESDTEVILHLYAEYGKDCLSMLRGMFAFAIWDDKEKTLFAARDRFGIKPFYYLISDNELIFSSELKAIKHYKKNLTISMEGVDAFLRTGSVPAPLTIYKEIKSLLPGCYLHLNNAGKLELNQYWSFSDFLKNPEDPGTFIQTSKHSRTYTDIAKIEIRNALLNSVKSHLVSDVEVGAFLSGGIDSTAIVSLMRQLGHEKIKTISVTFPGFVYDESEYSNVAARKFGTDHFEYRLKEDEIIDDLDKIIDIMDQPTIDGINTYFVSKAAASFGLKVILSGLGGDELFGGYPSFSKIPQYHRITNLPFAKIAMKAAVPFVKNKLPAKAVRFMKEPGRLNSEYIFIRGLYTDDELTELGWEYSFQHPFAIDNIKAAASNLYDVNHPVFNIKDTPFQFICEMETNHYMRNQLLRDADIFSMAHSIEVRVPYVDHLLYGSALPYLRSGFDKNNAKKMLVTALEDIPRSISNRMKMGFTFPFDVWMRKGKLKDVIKETLLQKDMNNFIPFEGRKKVLEQFENGKIHWSRVWALNILSKFS